MDARIGQQLGNYRLIRLLGQGGFADVYLGEHVHLGTQAALKVLQVRLMGEHLELFRNEARTIASLVHPNIVRVFDFGVEAGTPFLVMDYAPHGSLRQRYARGSIVPPQQIVTALKQVAAALHYAHQKRFIHRDVKPENMLLGINDEVLLSDFGLVLVEQSTGSQLTREAAGTLPYMAPEQLQGKPRAASDQYALGIVVYEWLCGERPFRGSPMELIGQHSLTPPPPLRQRVSNIPPAVEAVVLKALSKEPQERFADVETFATALEAACREALAQPILAADSLTDLRASLNPTVPSEILPSMLTQVPTEFNPSMQNQDAWPTSAPTYMRPNAPTSSTPDVLTSDTMVRTPPSSGPQTPPPSTPSWTQATTVTPVSPSSPRSDPFLLVTPPTQGVSPLSEGGSSTPSGLTRPAIPLPVQPRAPEQHARKRGWLMAALLLLALMLGGGGIAVRTWLLGSSGSTSPTSTNPGGITSFHATVSITPVSQDVHQNYTLSAVTGTPDSTQKQVQARNLSVTSSTQSQTVNATGSGQIPAISASGILHFRNYDVFPHTLNANLVIGNDGSPSIHMRLDSAVTIPASTGAATGNIDAPAHVVEAGTIGNIPLQNPDGSSPFMHSGTGWIAFNNSAFSGGQDPQSFTAVAQSDIDSAISSLVNRLTPGTQQSVQAQVLSHERSLGQPQCSHQVSSNHRAGDQASSLTVTGTVTCALETYDYNGALALATHLLEMQAEQIPGPSYALGGTVVSTLTQVQLADAKTGTITLTVKSAGIWVFQFSQTQQQTLKTAIAGKRKADALSYLQSQPGVQAAAIQIGQGDNATLPTDTSSIQIVIQPAQNPQATPASTGAAGS